MTVSRDPAGKWKLYWGSMPLPAGATSEGTVTVDHSTGALVRLANGNEVMGNAGAIRSIPRDPTGAQRQAKRRESGRQVSIVLRDPAALAALDRLSEQHGGPTAAITAALKTAK